MEALLRSASVPEDTRLEPDESLEPFGVVVRQLGGSIDSQLSSQLESLQRQLLPTTENPTTENPVSENPVSENPGTEEGAVS